MWASNKLKVRRSQCIIKSWWFLRNCHNARGGHVSVTVYPAFHHEAPWPGSVTREAGVGGGVTFYSTHDMTNIMDNTWKESNKGRLGDESRLGLPHLSRICSLKFHEEGRRKWRSPSVNMSHVTCTVWLRRDGQTRHGQWHGHAQGVRR